MTSSSASHSRSLVVRRVCAAIAGLALATSTAGSSAADQDFWPGVKDMIPLANGPPPLAMAVGAPGEVWLATPGPPTQSPITGELIGIDASTRQAKVDQPIGGDPEAVAYSGPFIWIVNGSGDGKTVEADANTIVALDATTLTEVARYQSDQPYAVAAVGDQAWVASSGAADTTTVTTYKAEAGTATATGSVAGSDAAGRPVLVVGADAAFIVTRVSEDGQPARDTVYRVDASGQTTARADLPTFGNATLAYADGAVFVAVANLQAGGVYRLDASTLAITATLTNDGASGLTTANGHVWVLSLDGTSVQPFDTTSGQPLAASVMLAGRSTLLAADAQQVFVSTQIADSNQLVLVAPS